MAHHEIAPEPANIAWGYLDAAVPPVLTVASGDTVSLASWPAGDASAVPDEPGLVDPLHRKALETLERGPGPHMVTGPVAVEGAEPGDVLQIDILESRPIYRWGHVTIRSLMGALPDEFDRLTVIHPEIDPERMVARMPWGTEIPLGPFFGTIAVAPPAHWGRLSTVEPRIFGGNMDNKELVPGTTLYLPVFNPGALFWAGDGHGVQGDGEVCVTALETALAGTFRLTVRKDLDYPRPFAESATHLISIGLDADLDDAAAEAVAEMVDHVCRRTNLGREQAYMLCSLAGDLRVTQLVDREKGCHMMLAKALL